VFLLHRLLLLFVLHLLYCRPAAAGLHALLVVMELEHRWRQLLWALLLLLCCLLRAASLHQPVLARLWC
jgi:hypothetical protein